MPKTKNALIRQRVLDRCLGSMQDYSMKDLMDDCNKELLSYGEHPVTSMNTIREDLNQICSNYPDANIIPRRVGRNIFIVMKTGSIRYSKYHSKMKKWHNSHKR